jgi:hypothetical protein
MPRARVGDAVEQSVEVEQGGHGNLWGLDERQPHASLALRHPVRDDDQVPIGP